VLRLPPSGGFGQVAIISRQDPHHVLHGGRPPAVPEVSAFLLRSCLLPYSGQQTCFLGSDVLLNCEKELDFIAISANGYYATANQIT